MITRLLTRFQALKDWWEQTRDREPTEIEEIAWVFVVVVGSYLALYAHVNAGN